MKDYSFLAETKINQDGTISSKSIDEGDVVVVSYNAQENRNWRVNLFFFWGRDCQARMAVLGDTRVCEAAFHEEPRGKVKVSSSGSRSYADVPGVWGNTHNTFMLVKLRGDFHLSLNGRFLHSTKPLTPGRGFHINRIGMTVSRYNRDRKVQDYLAKEYKVAVFDGAGAKSEAESYVQILKDPWAAARQVQVTEKALDDREKLLNLLETRVATDRKTVGDREASLGKREQKAKNRETQLDNREKKFQEKEKELERHVGRLTEYDGKYLDGASEPTPASANIHPPDYDALNIATSSAWPGAVMAFLRGQAGNSVKGTHQELMNDWVASRGDNLSPDAYDYLVYSHGIGWPKAILQSTTEDIFLLIRTRFMAIMKASQASLV